MSFLQTMSNMSFFARAPPPPPPPPPGPSGIAIAGFVISIVGTGIAISALVLSIIALVLVLRRTERLERESANDIKEEEALTLSDKKDL
jgi:hypothetical protein